MDISKNMENKLRKLFDSQLTCVLATSRNSKPYCCLVSFLITDDFRYVVFATKRARLKYKHMQANPSVALLIDNTMNQPTDVTEAISVTIQGTVIDTKGAKRVQYSNLLAERHPEIKDFVKGTDTAIMQVTIEKMYVVSNFESVELLDFN